MPDVIARLRSLAKRFHIHIYGTVIWYRQDGQIDRTLRRCRCGRERLLETDIETAAW